MISAEETIWSDEGVVEYELLLVACWHLTFGGRNVFSS